MTGNPCMGYVTNNYSASGRVQVRVFGEHDGVGDTTQCKWVYPDQGMNNVGVAGVGSATNLQPGCRVLVSQLGGLDGSFWAHGTGFRGGQGTGGGGGLGSGQSDGSTSMNDVDRSKADNCIPLENPNQQDGMRCQAKALDGRYNMYAGGQPLDLTSSQYPTTQYKDS